ncbi:MAG: signal peptidase I [Clostridia bacterium]|nr:signal peptidase I [Clostridia bacterium]
MMTQRRTEVYRPIHIWNSILNWLIAIVVAGLVLYFLFFVWFTPARIDGTSMSPMLKEKQIVLIDRAKKYLFVPERGEIIAFSDPVSGSLQIKRIIALPGETVEIRNGRVYINGLPVSEAYAVNTDAMDAMKEIRVPQESVFVLSDNREVIYDSRSIDIGCIPYQKITGIVKLRIFPFQQINLFI